MVDSGNYSIDGKLLVTGDLNGKVILWDVESANSIRVLTFGSDLQGDSIRKVCFSPDGKYIVAGFSNGKLLVWDAATVKKGSITDSILLNKKTGSIHVLSCNPSEESIFVGDFIDGATFSINGKYLACAEENKITIFEVTTGKHVYSIKTNNVVTEGDICYSPDGRLIAIGSYKNPVKIFELENSIVSDEEITSMKMDRNENFNNPLNIEVTIEQAKQAQKEEWIEEGKCMYCGNKLSFFRKISGKKICNDCKVI